MLLIFESLKLLLTILIFKLFFSSFIVEDRGKGSFISAVENKQLAVSVSVSFLIFLSFSVYPPAKCPLTQCFEEHAEPA